MGEKKYSQKRAAPELIVGDAPTAPRLGGKGLQSNTVYQYEDEDETPRTEEFEHEKRTGKLLRLAVLNRSKTVLLSKPSFL